MSLRSNVVRVLPALLLIASLNVATLADTIRLKDGSIIKGKITGFSGGKFTVAIGKRQMSFSAGEIESIDFDSPLNQTTAANNDRVASTVKIAEKKPAVIRRDDVAVTEPPPTSTQEVIEEEKEPVRVTSTPPASQKTARLGKPVELSVKVLADNTANGWTNSGWIVKKGQRIRISGSGEVTIGAGKKTGPSGLYDLEDKDKLLKSVPTGALIAVIGDDNNEFIYIGAEREFTAARDGALFLGLNEGNLNDNTGFFEVRVEIATDGAE